MFFPRQPMNQMRPMRQMRPPSMHPRPFGFQPQGMHGGMQGRSGLGGLIKRLFPSMGRTGPMQGIGGMQGLFNPSSMQGMNPSTLQNLANPANLSAMMGNVQKTLKMAESVVPIVQQYGPLMKNIPAMIKMYSAIKNADFDEEEDTDTVSLSDITEDDDQETENELEKPTAKGSGQSVPKLYI